MKIGIFTNNYLPNPYGVPGSVETFRKEFERSGHEVFIFAPHWPGYTDANRNVFRYPSIDLPFLKFRFPLAVPRSIKLDKLIADLDLDIIHAQHPNLLGKVASRWAKKKNIPLVFTWHTLYDRYAHFATIIPERLFLSKLIKNAVRFANAADRIVVPTDSIIPILKKWRVSNKDIRAIPTGVDEEEFENPDGKEVRERLRVGEDEILVVLISRMTEEKNVPFVFESLENILRDNPRAKFLAVGGGDLVEKMKKWSRNRGLSESVIMAGQIPRNQIRNYYAAGDIFVYASLSETQGMTITEAMYSGLPIVAVRATGTSSLVENGKTGFLVSEDKEEFSDKVRELIQEKDLREKMGQEAARIARQKYTARASAEKMLQVYQEAIEKHQ